MSKLRKHDHTIDGSDWDLSLLSLSDVPVDDLKKNPKARKVDLSNNAIVKLPDSFTSLTHLVVLDLSRNQLQELPQSFGDLNKLIRLDLYSNQLKRLPLSFGQLSRLKWLDLKGNPLESSLAKYAGDCANQRQCELCAVNCLRFVRNEKLRIESEDRLKQIKLQEKLEYEKQMQQKKGKEKEKKKAKNARRTARKVQLVDENAGNGLDNTEDDEDMNDGRNARQRKSGNRSFCGSLFRWLFGLALVLLTILMGISIGLHLQKGQKLHTTQDMINAFDNCIKSIANYKVFMKDTTNLIVNLVNGLKRLGQTYFETKLNATKP